MYSNPYSDVTFFEFFVQLCVRLWGFVTGHLNFSNLATDEIQIIVLACIAASSALV